MYAGEGTTCPPEERGQVRVCRAHVTQRGRVALRLIRAEERYDFAALVTRRREEAELFGGVVRGRVC